MTLAGRGAAVTVYRSMANGRSQRVDSGTTDEGGRGTFTFELPLKPFVDGGWYWFDVVAGDDDVVVEGAEWTAQVPEDRAANGTTTVGITTMNRPDFCAKLLAQIGEDEDLAPFLDEVFVAEQGTQKVIDSPEFAKAQAALGDRLRIVEQGNLGGSGGYARGQLETVQRGTATYFMCMDDDVVCEPEGIIRATTFGDLARRPTIVGGHMFSLYSRSRLHSFGEIIQPYRFWWQSPPSVHNDWDFAARNLRSTRWLHRRVDVDFNGWFMCLIPTQILARDRAVAAAVHQVGRLRVRGPGQGGRLPDGDVPRCRGLARPVDRQERRAGLAVLLPPAQPLRRGAAALAVRTRRPDGAREPQPPDQAPRLDAVLHRRAAAQGARGRAAPAPRRCTATSATKLTEVRETAKTFSDAQLQADPDAFPPVRRKKPPRKGKDGTEIPGRLSQLVTAGLAPIRQLRPTRDLAREFPEAEILAMDAKWYRLARYDSAVVSMPDGTSAALYQRDPAKFRDLLRRTLEIHQQLHREWPELAEHYRSKLGEITSPETWAETFGITTGGDEMTDTPRAVRDVVERAPALARPRPAGCSRSSGVATC